MSATHWETNTPISVGDGSIIVLVDVVQSSSQPDEELLPLHSTPDAPVTWVSEHQVREARSTSKTSLVFGLWQIAFASGVLSTSAEPRSWAVWFDEAHQRGQYLHFDGSSWFSGGLSQGRLIGFSNLHIDLSTATEILPVDLVLPDTPALLPEEAVLAARSALRKHAVHHLAVLLMVGLVASGYWAWSSLDARKAAATIEQQHRDIAALQQERDRLLRSREPVLNEALAQRITHHLDTASRLAFLLDGYADVDVLALSLNADKGLAQIRSAGSDSEPATSYEYVPVLKSLGTLTPLPDGRVRFEWRSP